MTQPQEKQKPLTYISCGQLFWVFFRIGLFTFGGGFAMLTILRYELVVRRRWISEDAFLESVSLATAIPGAVAVNIAYYQGYRLRQKTGAIVAALATILPSFLIILLIAVFFLPYFQHPSVNAFFKGATAAVAAQLFYTAYTFAKTLGRTWQSILLTTITVTLVAGLRLHPVWAVMATVIVGFLVLRQPRPIT